MQRILRRRPASAASEEPATSDLSAGQEAQETAPVPSDPSFRERGRLRRRLRYLRRARELGYRDLGGLVFDLARFKRERPDLVAGKLKALESVDTELRSLEIVLDDRRPIHLLREPGVSACPRCATVHPSEANYCPHCGLALGTAPPLDSPSPAPAGEQATKSFTPTSDG